MSQAPPPSVPLPGSLARALVARGRGPVLGAALLAWVAVLAARTPVPSEDGVSYLWMAERMAAGDFAGALSLVFPPGFPLLCAPWIACGGDAETVARLVGAVCLLLTLLPLARIAEGCRAGAGWPAMVLFAASPLLPRLAAEVYSEPPFLLAMAWGTCCGLRHRHGLAGAWAGLAFWVRPEGLLLVAAFAFVQPRRAVRLALPAAAAVLLLAVVRWCTGHGFDALPIHGFHEQRDDLPLRGAWFTNLLQVPGAWLEAFGPAGLLPLVPLLLCRRAMAPVGPAVPGAVAALWWQAVLQVAVVCTFVVRRRFFVSAAVAVLALAGAAVAGFGRRWRAVALLGCAGPGLAVGFLGTIEPDRLAERQLGGWLAQQLEPGRTVTGDLPRVLWFAGERPPPPRHFDSAQLAAMAAPPAVQFVVIGERSQRASSRQVLPLLAPSFTRVVLPEPLAAACAARGIAVLQRR